MNFKLEENVSLKDLTTLRLGGKARYLAHVRSVDELEECLKWADQQKLGYFILSGGSNTLFGDSGFTGLVIKIEIKGLELIKNDSNLALVKIGAGEIWDDVVRQCVEQGLAGIEALSLIPGLAGSAPVQNIGAYGQEISQTITAVEAYDSQNKQMTTLQNADCGFSYRNSIFKAAAQERYIITSITLRLSKQPPEVPDYEDLKRYFDDHKIAAPSLSQIRQAVIAIRQRKLPDPATKPNAGSFFKNPIISASQFEQLAQKFPELNEAPVGWPQPPRWFLPSGEVKLSAARLIELAGLNKGHRLGTAQIDDKHTLVLENIGGQSAADLFHLKDEIIDKVKTKFGITLEPEPVIVS